jgi:hypothetical protein
MKKFLPGILLIAALTAPTALSAQGVAGDWAAAMNTPGGAVNFGLALMVKGDTVTGTVHRSAGDVPLFGRTKGDSVVFAYTVQYNGHDLTLTMAAKVAGDSLLGSVDFDGQGSDAFWAARLKRKPGGRAP